MNSAFPGLKGAAFDKMFGDITDSFGEMLNKIKKKTGDIKDDTEYSSKLPPIQQRSNLFKQAAPAAQSAVADVMSPFRALTGTIGAVTGAFNEVISAAGKYVQALSPVLIERLNYAFRDLNAVVGVALTPVIEAATVIVRQFAAILFPITDQLRPVIQTFAGIFTDTLGPVLNLFGKGMEVVVGVLSFVAEAYKVFAPLQKAFLDIITVFQSIARAIMQTVLGFFTSLFGEGAGTTIRSAFEEVGKAVAWLGKMFLLATAHIARFVGVTSYITNLIQALRPARRRDATGLAAAQNVSNQTAEAFGLMVSRAAAIATYGGGDAARPRTTEDWLEEVVGELQSLQAGGETSLNALGDKLIAFLKEKFDEMVNSLRAKAFDAVNSAGATAGQGGAGGLVAGGLAVTAYDYIQRLRS